MFAFMCTIYYVCDLFLFFSLQVYSVMTMFIISSFERLNCYDTQYFVQRKGIQFGELPSCKDALRQEDILGQRPEWAAHGWETEHGHTTDCRETRDFSILVIFVSMEFLKV